MTAPTFPQARTSSPDVPFLDLGLAHADLRSAILEEFADVIDQSAFINGSQVSEFETQWAEYCGAQHAVGLASGLDALRLGLLAAGLRPGDEVLVPANTFVATFEAVTQAGGSPVPVDASESDYNIDIEATAAAVSSRTTFILPVHLYGQLADMRRVDEVARTHGLCVLEDACQAHGASRDGVNPGSLSALVAYSFYPGKNLGAFGDAGAATTDDDAIAERMRALREHGQRAKYRHELEGYTARLDTLQAVALRHKLPLLDEWNEQRRAIAAMYRERLADVGDLTLPPVASGSEPVWHLFVVLTARPGELAAFLRERGIATGFHYPEPPHLSQAYAWLGYERGAFPVAERLAEQLLSLPIFPGMTEDQVETVVSAINGYFVRG